MPPLFVLASTSPARRQLLLQAGITPLVRPSHFDESSLHREDPAELVEQLALGKATAVAQALREDPSHANDCIVLGCDSVLVVAGEVCGKPETPEVAIARWQQMRGRQGTLLTGHALLAVAADPSTQPSTLLRHQVTQVSFANVSDPEIEAYVATGEPLQCAGAFALDGRGSLFVEQITGCYSNVIGLSLPLLREMLADLGYDALGFWSGNTEGIPASS